MAEAHILLEADAFAAGEQVSGSIVLTSSALITAVCLLLTGKEAWRLPYEGDPGLRTTETLSLRIEVQALGSGHITPGESVYPFAFALPGDIGGSMSADHYGFRADIEYLLTVQEVYLLPSVSASPGTSLLLLSLAKTSTILLFALSSKGSNIWTFGLILIKAPIASALSLT